MDKLDPYFKTNNEYLAIMSKENGREVKPIPIKFEVNFSFIYSNVFKSIHLKHSEIQKMNTVR